MHIPYPELIAIIRHGEAEQNVVDADARATARCGVPNHAHPLTGRGWNQVAWLHGELRELAPEGFDAAYVSPYLRTWQTFEGALPDFPHRQVFTDARIGERWRGIWHTHGPAWVDRHAPWEREAQANEGWYHSRPAGGESVMDVEARVASFLTDLRLRHPGERVAVFTHNTTSIAALRHALNMDVRDAVRMYEDGDVPNCNVFALAPSPCGRRLALVKRLQPPVHA